MGHAVWGGALVSGKGESRGGLGEVSVAAEGERDATDPE